MKVALGWAYWTAYQALSLFFGAVGLIAIYFLARAQAWELEPTRIPAFAPRNVLRWRGGWLTAAWCNDEDGVLGGQAFALETHTLPLWKQAYIWSALRNFSNGLRRLPGAFYVVTKDDKIDVRLTNSGSVTTCGWRQCVVWRGIRFGFLINRNATTGYRVWPVAGRA